MGRQCARAGCSAIAAATFTFDAERQTVWLDEPRDGAARAGELCERHAQLLTPPRGWQLDDRRGATEPLFAEPFVDRAPEPALEPVGSIQEPVVEIPVEIPVAIPVAVGAPEPPSVEDPVPELRILLDAHTPLLARAFESAGTV